MSRRCFLRTVATGIAGAVLTLPWERAFANDLIVGKTAPPLTLHTLDGRILDTRDFRGQVILLTFWASWCEPCRVELPLLSRYFERHASQGLQIFGFTLDGSEQLPEVRKIAQSLSFPVGLLGSPWVRGYGRIWRLPVSFVIDRNGNLAHNGWKDDNPGWTEASLERIVAPLLK